MKEKGNYLIKFNNKVKRALKQSDSFTYFYDYILNSNLKFITKYIYADTISRVDELKKVINKISSIISKPHIQSVDNEIILRSELASKISNESFFSTLKDSRLWKYKDNKPTPEYVYSIEHIDSLKTYENRFIRLLIDSLEEEILNILGTLFPLVETIEEHFEMSGVSYGEYSIFKDFNSLNYPYEGIFNKKSSSTYTLFKEVKKLEKRIKQIKNTEFYKVNSTYIDKNILPTNILIHDELYSYCYKFYKMNYLIEDKDEEYLNSYYYNYVFASFIYYLSQLNIAKTTQSNKAKIYFDKDNRIRFTPISFKRGLFSYFIKEDESRFGFNIETRLIENAIRVNTNVDESKIARYSILTSYLYNLNNKDKIKEEMNESNKINNNTILFTMNNTVGNFNSVLALSVYNKNHDLLFKNLVSSLSMLFKVDEVVYEHKCPVCGSKNIMNDGYSYYCEDCLSTYSLLNVNSDNVMWIKSFRRN